MSKVMRQPLQGRAITLPFWVLGIAGLLVLWIWLVNSSTVFAQDEGAGGGPNQAELECIERALGRTISGPDDLTEEEKQRIGALCSGGRPPQDGPRGDDHQGGRPGFPGNLELNSETIPCIVQVLGRVPSGQDDISPQEMLLIAERCLGGVQGVDRSDGRPSRSRGGPDTQTMQCVVEVLGRMPTHEDDLTTDEKRLVGQKCFAGHGGGPSDSRGRQGGPGPELDDATLQCVVSTIGRMPSSETDLTNEEKILLGEACFGGHIQRPGERGGPGGQGGPGDLDSQTIQCITDTIGRVPTGPQDMTNEEMVLVGRACFGGGGPDGHGAPGDLDASTIQCITDTVGRLPSGPDDLTQDEKRLIGQACFGGEVHGGPGDLDNETIQCVTDTLGRLPSGPEDMTNEESLLVARACFEGEGPGDIDNQTMECIVDVLGFLPSGPDELSEDQKRLVGRECFDDEGPDDLDEDTRQCIIDTLGFLPDGPEELDSEQLNLVTQACFADEHAGPEDVDPSTRQCIIELIGFVPESADDLTDEDKRLVGLKCFGDDRQDRRDGRQGPRSRAVGLSQEVQQCIVRVVGRVPSNRDELTSQQKRIIAQQCYGRQARTSSGRSSGGSGSTSSGQQPVVDTGGQQSTATFGQTGDDSGGQQASTTGGQDSGTDTGGQQTTTTSGQSDEDSGGQQASSGGQTSPADEPETSAPPSTLVLTEAGREIQRIIIEHNIEIAEMDASGVVGRLQNARGSLTSAIKVLSVVNHLIAKGKDVSDAEWIEVFEKLEGQLDDRG